MTHTPGPWGIAVPEQTDAVQRLVTFEGSEYGQAVATIHGPGWGATQEGMQANARLIAAAPELLEILQTITSHAQETYPHFESERGQLEIAEALTAIAKATGSK